MYGTFVAYELMPRENPLTTVVTITAYIDNPLMYDYQEEANFVYNLDGGLTSPWSHPTGLQASQVFLSKLSCVRSKTLTAFLLKVVTWADIDVFGSGRLGAARSSPR